MANESPLTTFSHAIDTMDRAILRISGDNNEALLVIHPDGTVEGTIENASEAAAVFVREIRRLMAAGPVEVGL